MKLAVGAGGAGAAAGGLGPAAGGALRGWRGVLAARAGRAIDVDGALEAAAAPPGRTRLISRHSPPSDAEGELPSPE